jgi:hypothetical protein
VAGAGRVEGNGAVVAGIKVDVGCGHAGAQEIVNEFGHVGGEVIEAAETWRVNRRGTVWAEAITTPVGEVQYGLARGAV